MSLHKDPDRLKYPVLSPLTSTRSRELMEMELVQFCAGKRMVLLSSKGQLPVGGHVHPDTFVTVGFRRRQRFWEARSTRLARHGDLEAFKDHLLQIGCANDVDVPLTTLRLPRGHTVRMHMEPMRFKVYSPAAMRELIVAMVQWWGQTKVVTIKDLVSKRLV
ncbi:MAG: hypothetical protein ABIH41_05660 [Nanoarchaeota archaeon]